MNRDDKAPIVAIVITSVLFIAVVVLSFSGQAVVRNLAQLGLGIIVARQTISGITKRRLWIAAFGLTLWLSLVVPAAIRLSRMP